ncbi:tetratricopeptide repeat protein [Leptolyngbya sp. FACHB-541]|uniref:tetratricopeptide repeat protein n=1 Tax=Leptolyngbya sp. FACHB-541 TaxID=2692810 RepID=UPI0016838C6C|nr:tetratricopeptide repeat protein [Leptolyngbya sp. FACHB-541]MBD1995250.1 tetratricopeptide repeat protein [Leptolyngbya sp. FACHB-541]
MNSLNRVRSIQDVLKQRQQSGFVGRTEQVAQFRQNLELPLEDYRRWFIFNASGQGGIGKSTLLKQFRKIAEERGVITAHIDEAEKSVPEVLGRFGEHLEKHYKLGQFSERYKVFRQKRQELETDAEAPQGFSAFVSKTAVKASVKLARRIPVGGAVFDLVDEDVAAAQAGEWASYVAKKLTNKDEVRLVQEPIEVLTPLFLEEIKKIAEKSGIILFFDTYERTGNFLDNWLQDVIEGRYGEIPLNVLFVIAGRHELDKNRWASYEGLITRMPLEPFTEEEAQQFLAQKGITSKTVVDVILRLSGRLPLLVATLATEIPHTPDEVGDPSGTAVERFLSWVDDSKRRQVALDAAIPQYLNRDVLAQLREWNEADELFDWLKEMPFVEERTDGWMYHEIVRSQMLRHKRLAYPQSWAELHGKLADYFERLRNELQLSEEVQRRDLAWQSYTLNVLYHRLCQAPQKNLAIALNEFLAALKNQRKFALRWAETMMRAAQDRDATEILRWSEQLIEGLKAYEEERYEVAAEMFTALIGHSTIEAQWKPIGLAWRGEVYRLMEYYEEALIDFDRAIELDPAYAWAIASRGETYQDMERYEEALKDFDKAIELDPKSSWKIAQRGLTYQDIDRYREALEDFNKVIELDPKYSWAIAQRGLIHRLMERYEEALKDFDKAIKLDPKYSWAIAQRGLIHRLMERYEEALKDFDKAIELDPKYSRAIAQRGITYRLMERYEASLTDLQKAIASEPDFEHVGRKEIGLTFQSMGLPEKAIDSFLKSLSAEPACPECWLSLVRIHQLVYPRLEIPRLITEAPIPQLERAVVRYCRARAMSKAGYKDYAIVDFSEAIDSDSSYIPAIAHRGITYRELEQYEKSLEDLDRAIELNPQGAWAIAHRGITYRELEQYEKSLEDLDRAIELDPQDAWAIAHRGITYRELEQYEKSLEDLDRAIELDPQDAWAVENRADTYRLMRLYDEALTDFDTAMSSGRDCWGNQGLVLTYLGRYSEAIQNYRESLKRNPNAFSDLYNIAIATVRLRGVTDAYLQIEAVRPTLTSLLYTKSRGTALYGLGGLEAVTGNIDAALNYLEQSISLKRQAVIWARQDVAWLDLHSNEYFQDLISPKSI